MHKHESKGGQEKRAAFSCSGTTCWEPVRRVGPAVFALAALTKNVKVVERTSTTIKRHSCERDSGFHGEVPGKASFLGSPTRLP